jgi:fatty acid-binding protein DegV
MYDRIVSLAVAFSMEAAEEWRKTNKDEDKDLAEVLEDIHNHIAATRPVTRSVH